ncbi:MAG: L-2-amino-thiazoline-4-carboxylic acid hydrolase [Spirochaetales bacterium]|nr:L-2-amino-thiazoline-4-carboxylic acid hydrolase [Spirochaetales bacterium]
MAIKNNPQERDSHIESIRNAIEHRAAWMYFLLDEAKKRGLEWEDFGREAILRCGRFHGQTKFPDTENMKVFGEAFATEELKKVFDMNVVQCDEEAFTVEFNYCPLVSSWMKHTGDEKDIELLCDIAMDGDRGIVEEYPGFSFDLQSTIACGDDVCRLTITKSK